MADIIRGSARTTPRVRSQLQASKRNDRSSRPPLGLSRPTAATLLILTGFLSPWIFDDKRAPFKTRNSAIYISDRSCCYFGGRNPLELIQPIIFVPVATFST
jgi:hypothetical protein